MPRRPITLPLPNGLHAEIFNASDATILYQQVLEYFQHGIEVRPGMTVVDIGANIGIFAQEVLHRTGGHVRLVCVEPAPATFKLLCRNVSGRFADAAVSTVQCAISAKPGRARFYYRPNAHTMSSFQDRNPVMNADGALKALHDPNLPPAYARVLPRWMTLLPRSLLRFFLELFIRHVVNRAIPIDCEVTTLSRLMVDHRVTVIDLLKVDVEGAELEVLRGIDAQDWPRIRALVIEVHDVDGRLSTVRQLLDARGFRRVTVDQEYIFRGGPIYNVYALRDDP